MAVPKKKTSKSVTKTRHKAYVQKQNKKLSDRVSIVACSNCAAAKLNHVVCPECGYYNGKQVLDTNKSSDITTIKA